MEAVKCWSARFGFRHQSSIVVPLESEDVDDDNGAAARETGLVYDVEHKGYMRG